MDEPKIEDWKYDATLALARTINGQGETTEVGMLPGWATQDHMIRALSRGMIEADKGRVTDRYFIHTGGNHYAIIDQSNNETILQVPHGPDADPFNLVRREGLQRIVDRLNGRV